MKNFGKTMQTASFVLIGFILGGVLSFFLVTNLFDTAVKRNRLYIEADWIKVQHHGSRIADKLIVLRRMIDRDGVKFDVKPIIAAIDARAMVLGTEDIAEKAKHLEEMEKNISAVIEEYNKRLDLRNLRFSYVEWGIETKKVIEEYNEYKNRYIEAANEFNHMIRQFPFNRVAGNLGYKEVPVISPSTLIYVSKKTEPYHKDNIYRIDKYEGSSSAGSY